MSVKIPLPLSFARVKGWVHETWVGLESCERMLTPSEGETRLNDAQLRLARTVLIHCMERGMIALNGLHEELMGRGDFGEDRRDGVKA